MPIFDYKCEKCEVVKEEIILQSQKDQDVICDTCKTKMVQLLAAPRCFVLKGKGFYKPSKSE